MALVDLIVKLRGAHSFGELEGPQLNEVFPQNFQNQLNNNPARSNRKIELVGFRTNTIKTDSESLLFMTMNSMRKKLENNTLGKILIYGSSSGGRNAIDLALRLTNNNIFPEYLATLDAAIFPDEVYNVPQNVFGKPTNSPKFFPGHVAVFKKENFFQTSGNDSKINFHGKLQFTSDMSFSEIHGQIVGFNNRDLTQSMPPPPRDNIGDFYHGKLIEQALPIVHSEITKILNI